MSRLHEAVQRVLRAWTERPLAGPGDRFPEKVTAFRDGMAAHGRFGRPCPRCGAPIRRTVYAANEANYCASGQTGGRLLADRALSRLLKQGFFNQLNEAFAYRHLARRGYRGVRMLPETGSQVPDLEYFQGRQRRSCEVKTVGLSEEEIARRESREPFSNVEALGQKGEAFFHWQEQTADANVGSCPAHSRVACPITQSGA